MRTFACAVFVLYLELARTAVAGGGGGGGTGTGVSSLTFAIFSPSPPQQDHYRAQHPERKIVVRHAAKTNHHHLRPSGYAEELTSRHNVSFESRRCLSIKHIHWRQERRCSASTREAPARGNCTVECCLLSSRKREVRQVCNPPCFEASRAR